MEATLHTKDGYTGQKAKHEPSLVSRHGRDREVWNRLVVEAVHVGQLIGEASQPRAAYDATPGTDTRAVQQISGDFLHHLVATIAGGGCGELIVHMLVMRLKAKQVIPQCRAVMISCTVDIPIASTPSIASILTSATVSKLGPPRQVYTPSRSSFSIPICRAITFAVWISLGSYVLAIPKNRVMETALHAHDRNSGEVTEHKPSNMAGHRRDREVWDTLIVEAIHISQLVSQRTQPRTANDSNLRAEFRTCQEIICNFLQRVDIQAIDKMLSPVDCVLSAPQKRRKNECCARQDKKREEDATNHLPSEGWATNCASPLVISGCGQLPTGTPSSGDVNAASDDPADRCLGARSLTQLGVVVNRQQSAAQRPKLSSATRSNGVSSTAMPNKS
uniref:Uncharacterized protein n=1 Tax=Anopheles culicifacies TaxID=139723 RepID=A0A182M0I2_9DIPT